MNETLARVEALAARWEAAAEKPMPRRADTETAQDQGVRIGVWHAVKTAAAELRAALDGNAEVLGGTGDDERIASTASGEACDKR